MNHVGRFARNVLLVHLAALAVLVVVMGIALREIYQRARDQAIHQAIGRQELLAAQTATAIKSYYDSIINDLNLLKSAEENTRFAFEHVKDRILPIRPATPAIDGRRLGALLWNQLHPPEGPGTRPAGHVDRSRVSHLLLLERRKLEIRFCFSEDETVKPEQIVEPSRRWLESVKRPSVSPLIRIGDADTNLVCVPVAGDNSPLLLAVVPLRDIQTRFLDLVNAQQAQSATLIDDAERIMATSDPALVGRSLTRDVSDQELRAMAHQYLDQARTDSVVLDQPVRIGPVTLKPRILTPRPIDLDGTRWTVLIASDLAEVDRLVRGIFRRGLLWAGLVFASLSLVLVSTAVQLIRGRVKLERMRHEILARELQQARRIQLDWLPQQHVATASMEIAATNCPASHISGDFYNWFDLPDGRVAVTIGDVTGHGMAAAFLMATTQLLVRTTMPRVLDPGQCLAEINRHLCTQGFNGQFVTMCLIVLDPRQGRMEVGVAGHPPPLVGDGGAFRVLPLEPHLVLGVEPETIYRTQQFPIPAPTSLVLYTDGIIEAADQDGGRFNVEGLRQTLETDPTRRPSSARGLIDRVVSAVQAFRGVSDLEDDVTMVVVHVVPAPAPAPAPAPLA